MCIISCPDTLPIKFSHHALGADQHRASVGPPHEGLPGSNSTQGISTKALCIIMLVKCCHWDCSSSTSKMKEMGTSVTNVDVLLAALQGEELFHGGIYTTHPVSHFTVTQLGPTVGQGLST